MERLLLRKLCLPLALTFAVCVFGLWAKSSLPASAPPADAIELPIVMYHHVLKETARLNQYTISPDEFRQDMTFLKEEGYTPILVEDLIAFTQEGTPLPEKPVMITFDDGYESFHEYVFPILEEFGYPAVFSVVGIYADQYSKVDDHHIRYSHCTWNQLALMAESGLVEVQNHSYNLHITNQGQKGAMKTSSESKSAYQYRLAEDLGLMQQRCQEYLHLTPTCFTYPVGYISKDALPVLKGMGFSAALTCEEKINYLTGDPEELFHLKRFNRPHGTSLQQILAKINKSS